MPLFGDLGDTVLWIPAVRAVRTAYPDARVVALCTPLTGRVLTDLGLVDAVVDANKHLFDRVSALLRPATLRLAWRLVRRLRRERFDTVILFHHLVTRWGALKFALISLGSGAGVRVGLDNGRGWFLTHRVPDRGFGHRHEAEYWLEVAAAAGAEGEPRLEFPRSTADRRRAAELLRPLQGERMIAIHPGTGAYGSSRRWPAARFARVGRLVAARLGARLVVVGTEEDRDQVDEVVRSLGGQVLDLAGQTSVGELAAVLERCAATVANDGGVAHVSAAVGTPVVSVFGPSNDRAWRPVGGVVVAADIPCRPCFYRDFERGKPAGCRTRECMGLVEPDAVARAVEAVVSEAGGAA